MKRDVCCRTPHDMPLEPCSRLRMTASCAAWIRSASFGSWDPTNWHLSACLATSRLLTILRTKWCVICTALMALQCRFCISSSIVLHGYTHTGRGIEC